MDFIVLDEKRTCVNQMRDILLEFPGMTTEELFLFFPTHDRDYLNQSLGILVHRTEFKEIEYNGLKLWVSKWIDEPSYKIYENREKTKTSLDLIRYMINSTDKDGYLDYEVNAIVGYTYPCDMIFMCDKSSYEVYDTTKYDESDMDVIQSFVTSIDEQRDSRIIAYIQRILIVKDKSDIDKFFLNGTVFYAVPTDEEGNFEFYPA